MFDKNSNGRWFLVALAALSVAAPAWAKTIYVAPCGRDSRFGQIPVCFRYFGAKRTIQAAIDAASNGDEVVVLPGTYYNQYFDFNGKKITVRSSAGPDRTFLVHIPFFPGARDVPMVTARSNETPDTELEGFTLARGNKSGMYIRNSSPTVRDCRFVRNRALTGGGMRLIGSDSLIEGCRFENNRAVHDEVWGSDSGEGGGISILAGAPMIVDCTFRENAAWGNQIGSGQGGAIFVEDSSPQLISCVFEDNTCQTHESAYRSWTYGAAMFNEHSDPFLLDCEFRGSAHWVSLHCCGRMDVQIHGGAMYNSYSSPTILLCQFVDNHAGQGGAIYNGRDSHPTIIDSDFVDNYAAGAGGAMFNYGAMLHSSTGRLTVQGCRFVNNTSSRGGAVYNSYRSAARFTQCRFSDNEARGFPSKLHEKIWGGEGGEPGAGGAIFNADESTPNFEGCDIVFNRAEADGGGVYSADRSAATLVNCLLRSNDAEHGGAFYNTDWSGLSLINCTIYGNVAAIDGGGIKNTNSALREVVNSILWANRDSTGTGEHAQIDGVGTLVSYSCVQGLTYLDFPGHYNIGDDPGFWGLGLELGPASPCIDAGDNMAVPEDVFTDLNGSPRFVNGQVDIGAFERPAPPRPRRFGPRR